MVSLPSSVSEAMPVVVSEEDDSLLPPSVVSEEDDQPVDVQEEEEMSVDLSELNAFDEDPEPIEDEDETHQLQHIGDEIMRLDNTIGHEKIYDVPLPGVAQHICAPQDIAEFYAPPRVAPHGRALGLRGNLSLDILSGWNFNDIRLVELSIKLLTLVAFVVLCPPCTAFSVVQKLWNFKKLPMARVQAKWAQGMHYLEHAMACAKKQALD
eukprot:4985481-Pyramimonas_sp.AAC.1